MKRKILMTIIFIMSLSTMFMTWFGGYKGVQEVSGFILMNNPIAVTCMMITIFSIWMHWGYTSYILCCIGLIGIIAMEIYEFLTWHIFPLSGVFSLRLSLELCYPQFYIALMSTIATFFIYKYYFWKRDLTKWQDYVS